jgi:serine/threonine protein kinase
MNTSESDLHRALENLVEHVQDHGPAKISLYRYRGIGRDGLDRVASQLNLESAAFVARFGHTRPVFMESIWTQYQALAEKTRRSEKRVRGVLGFLWLTGRLLDLAGVQRENANVPHADITQCNAVLTDPEVMRVFVHLYSPRKGEKTSTDVIDQWARIDWNTISIHRVGSTSVILRCEFKSDFNELALKCVLYPYTLLPDVQIATEKYAETIIAGNYSSVVGVYSSTRRWILMEFVHGDTLEEVMREIAVEVHDGPLDSKYVTRLGQPILEALRQLSEAPGTPAAGPIDRAGRESVSGIQHQDLTPSNIIISGDWKTGTCEAKLIDVGRNYLFSRRLGLDDSSETVYVSPEIREGDPTLTSDLFSFGRILASLLDPFRRGRSNISDNIYQEMPEMARFIEDLTDHDPANRLLVNADACDRGADHKITRIKYAVLADQLESELALLYRTQGYRQVSQDSPKSWTQLFKPNAGHRQRRETWNFAKAYAEQHPSFATQSYYLFVWSWISASILVVGVGISVLYAGLAFGFENYPGWFAFFDFVTHKQGSKFLAHLRESSVGFSVADRGINLSGAFIAFAMTVTSSKYYQAVLGGLTTYRLKIRGGWFTELSIRWIPVVALIPVLILNVFEPGWWPWIATAGGTAIMITNYACHRFARSCARQASACHLSTTPSEDDPSLVAYSQYWWSQAVYNLFMLCIGFGVITHYLKDYWVYAFGIGCITLFVQYALKCTAAAGSTRGILTRCFIAGERVEAKKRVERDV